MTTPTRDARAGHVPRAAGWSAALALALLVGGYEWSPKGGDPSALDRRAPVDAKSEGRKAGGTCVPLRDDAVVDPDPPTFADSSRAPTWMRVQLERHRDNDVRS